MAHSRRRRLLASARARILVFYLVLLLFSTVVGAIALREVLTARAGDRVDEALVQETEEFRSLARGSDPRTGEPFGDDVRAHLRRVPLAQRPRRERGVLHLRGRRAVRHSLRAGPPPPSASRLWTRSRTAASTQNGEVELDDGRRIRYVVVPVRVDGRSLGSFAVAIDLSAELDEVSDALRTAAGVSIGVLLLASALAWVVGAACSRRCELCAIPPARSARPTSPGGSTSQGDDELAEPRAHVQRDARPARGRPSQARRSSSATSATSCAPRSRSSAATSTLMGDDPGSGARRSSSLVTSSTG